MTDEPMRTERLVEELIRERDALLALFAAVAPESMTTPGLVGEWSARDLIAHLGYWAGHAVEIIHAVEQGRVEELADAVPTDEVNETVARVARSTELATVRRREEASVEALVERLRSLDLTLLDVTLPDGATLEQGIREDGSAHYREHAEELGRMLKEAPRG
jgi:hypothetical protein